MGQLRYTLSWKEKLRDVSEKTEDLDCSWNHLRSLNDFDNLVNLRKLNCSWNYLTSLEGIYSFANLRKLSCSFNSISSLKEISSLLNLRYLDCSCNLISSFENIFSLVNLRKLNCFDNSISSLKGLLHLEKLKFLNCIKNRLESLKFLPRNIFNISYRDNPIDDRCSDHSDPHELAGTLKFLGLKEERKKKNSYVGFMTFENLERLYLFF